jgi:hypothetical protein
VNLSAVGQRALGTSKLYFIKNGPAILTGAGVIGLVGTAVLAGRAAIKAKPVIDDATHGLKAIESVEIDAGYPQKQKGKDYALAIVDLVKDAGKIYAPAIIVGAVSISCIVSAHGMLRKQNAGLVAAYGALDLGFKAYRKRVIEEFGEDKDRDIYRGIIGREEETLENGQVCVIEDLGTNIPAASLYGRFFDECSTRWNKTPEYNLTFLISQQNYANDMLISRGHLFLNEVYDMLGFSRTQAGQVVGWKYYRNGFHPRGGDNYVSFGFHNIADEISRAFINGHERVVFLDFNVDGVITID